MIPRKLIRGKNDLASVHPNVAKQWHPTKNGNKKPSDFTCGSEKEIWWQCPNVRQHVYKMPIKTRTARNCGCKVCNQEQGNLNRMKIS